MNFDIEEQDKLAIQASQLRGINNEIYNATLTKRVALQTEDKELSDRSQKILESLLKKKDALEKIIAEDNAS